MMAPGAKAAIYVRMSKDKTGEELGVARQQEDALKVAEFRGWQVVRTEIDNDISAAGKKTRPGFEAILSAIESGEVSAVIAWDMTRLTRNRRDTVRVIEAGQRRNTVLAFVRASDLDLSTPSRRMVADILASVARQEIEQKSDRQVRANIQAAERGKRMGGRRPFGYESDGKTIRESESWAVRQAFDDILAGVSLGSIAREWNAAGLVTPQLTRKGEPSKWLPTTVRGVLTNPRYAGLRGYGPRPERGRPKIEAIAPAEWPGIVSEETWRAAVGLLSDPERYTARNKGARSLLTGIALCGVCGAHVHSGGPTHKKRIYRCSASFNGHVSRLAEPVEDHVSDVAIARLSREDAVELLQDDNRPDIDALRTEATALRARLEELATEFAVGELTSSQLCVINKKVQAQLATVEARMADTARVDVLGALIHAKDVKRVWRALSTDRRRAVIDALMIIRLMPPGRGTRTFRPETVIIEPRIHDQLIGTTTRV
jgi:site-specific DNA recombinase